ncbi:hypothetical protein AB1Y20_009564 [Prymnesium parvum]|uniref:Transmembrane protein n=1 Tax=Prymnesium parvum TaxID=97485 RepID=A0AB34K639_PRYPA
MLSARKLHLLAGLKVDGLDLRTRELDFYVTRFIAIGGVSSIMTYLSYVGLIKIKIPENREGSWEVSCFYVFGVLTLSFSMFNLFLTSFMVVNAQGLSLRGPPGSVARCVEICKANWLLVRLTLVGSLVCLFLAAVSIVWMKHDWRLCTVNDEGSGEGSGGDEFADVDETKMTCVISSNIISAIIATSVFFGLFAYMIYQMRQIARFLAIPAHNLVVGDLTVALGENDNLDIVAEGAEAIPAAK